MLDAFQLGNFKAFAETQRIPIKPITLIFGPNSGGKSSIIHGLVLAHEANREGKLDIKRTLLGGDSVDLGGFRQYVHRRDLGRTVEWGLELDTEDFEGRLAELLAPVKTVQLAVSIGLRQVEPTPGQMIATGIPHVQRYEVSADGKTLFRASARGEQGLRIDLLGLEHPVFREITRAIVLANTTSESVNTEDFETIDEVISALLDKLHLVQGNLVSSGVKGIAKEEQGTLWPVSSGQRQNDLAAAAEAFFPFNLNELLSGLAGTVENELNRLRYLGPLRSYPPRHLAFSEDNDPNWYAGGGYAWDEVRTNPELRAKVNAWLGSTDRLQTPYRLEVSNLVSLEDLTGMELDEPLHKALEEMVKDGLDFELDYDDTPDPTGSYPVIRDIDREKERIQQAILTYIGSQDWQKLPELILVDCRTECQVSHRDVGMGISQVLPVLVAAYGSKGQTIAIEQPEIHVHPGLQAELGDVFIESAMGENRNVFLLETHSEHLILRILKRIRQTTDGERPEGLPPLRREDVQVLYVEPTERGAVVVDIPVTEDGEFGRPWPHGFFAQRAEELM